MKDKKEGEGCFKWASGNKYTGQYKNDEREGFGEMRWTDGSIYIGTWIRGIQHGTGKMIFPNGTFKEGWFENNVYRGEHKPGKEKNKFEQPHTSRSYLDDKGIIVNTPRTHKSEKRSKSYFRSPMMFKRQSRDIKIKTINTDIGMLPILEKPPKKRIAPKKK